jgi:hypothetical protein
VFFAILAFTAIGGNGLSVLAGEVPIRAYAMAESFRKALRSIGSRIVGSVGLSAHDERQKAISRPNALNALISSLTHLDLAEWGERSQFGNGILKAPVKFVRASSGKFGLPSSSSRSLKTGKSRLGTGSPRRFMVPASFM